jgi:translocation and assembly module TamB
MLPLTKAHLTLTFAHGPNATDGAATLQADSQYGPARGRTAFRFSQGGIELSELDVDAGGAKAKGAMSLARRIAGHGRPDRGRRPRRLPAAGPGEGLGQAGRRAWRRRGAPRLDLTAEDVSSGAWKVRSARIKADGPLSRLPLSIDARGEAPGGRWRWRLGRAGPEQQDLRPDPERGRPHGPHRDQDPRGGQGPLRRRPDPGPSCAWPSTRGAPTSTPTWAARRPC